VLHIGENKVGYFPHDRTCSLNKTCVVNYKPAGFYWIIPWHRNVAIVDISPSILTVGSIDGTTMDNRKYSAAFTSLNYKIDNINEYINALILFGSEINLLTTLTIEMREKIKTVLDGKNVTDISSTNSFDLHDNSYGVKIENFTTRINVANLKRNSARSISKKTTIGNILNIPPRSTMYPVTKGNVSLDDDDSSESSDSEY